MSFGTNVKYTSERLFESDRKYKSQYKTKAEEEFTEEIRKDLIDGTDYSWLYITISGNKRSFQKKIETALLNIQHNIEQRVFKDKVIPRRNNDGSEIFDYQQYVRYYGFYESGALGDNPHYHILFRTLNSKIEWIKRIFPSFANKALPGASLKIDTIEKNESDIGNVVGYCAKQYLLNEDKFIIGGTSQKRKKGEIN